MNTELLFKIYDLHFKYGEQEVLFIENLEIESGKIIVLVGENGSGKTTLLKLLNGLLKPVSGVMRYFSGGEDEQDIAAMRMDSVFVHQDPYLFSGTVFQNVAYGLKARKVSRERIRREVIQNLQLMGLEGFETRRVSSLSSGERQRVAVARALVLKPRVLFLDEPTANMDPPSVELIEGLIDELVQKGTSVVLSSHHLGFAYRMCHRLVVLENGRVGLQNLNILKGRIAGQDDRFTYFETGGQLLRCPCQEGSFSAAVIPMDDVILSETRLHTSAQNNFRGTVKHVRREDNLCRITIDCGYSIEAHITEYSVEKLTVKPGRTLFIAFKASAVRLY